MAKTFKIIFDSEESIGMALYELEVWYIPRNCYEISTKKPVLYHCSYDALDIVLKTGKKGTFEVEEE